MFSLGSNNVTSDPQRSASTSSMGATSSTTEMSVEIFVGKSKKHAFLQLIQEANAKPFEAMVENSVRYLAIGAARPQSVFASVDKIQIDGTNIEYNAKASLV